MSKSALVRFLAAGLLSTAALVVPATAASAAALTSVGWSVSRPHPGDTAARYTWSFTTATSGSIKSVTMDVPAGTAGAALTVADAYGISAGGTANLAGTTVTYTMGAPVAVAAGVTVMLALDGFTNTATPGSYASTVTTRDNGAATIDTAGSNSVAISNNSTAVTVKVARSTGFTLSSNAFTLPLDPSVPALADRNYALTITVATNAASGYNLDTRIDHQLVGTANPGVNMSASSAGKATGYTGGSFPVNTFGYNVAVTGTGAVSGAGFAGTGYVGYTVPGETVVTAAGPTNGDTVTVTNRAKVDFLAKADSYTGTVTYTVTPSY